MFILILDLYLLKNLFKKTGFPFVNGISMPKEKTSLNYSLSINDDILPGYKSIPWNNFGGTPNRGVRGNFIKLSQIFKNQIVNLIT